MTHLLVTNDFPPKLGGIQSYLWELWRRLEPDRFEVLTTAHPDAAAFDAAQAFRVHRLPEAQTKPTPGLAAVVRERAREMKADLVVVDPAVPLGVLAPRLGLPYAVVLHGAEVTVPGRLPVSRQLLAHVIRRSALVVAAGGYPAAEGARVAGRGRMPPVVVVPPGVDGARFRPLDADERGEARRRFGLAPDGLVVVSLSRLVPRKGMDVLVRAAARLAPELPDLTVAIGGDGRDRGRLERLVAGSGAPVRLVGAVPDSDLPAFYGCADLFCMLCRNRWAGLEQEGFGIVFLEAAAAGVAQVAGASGGADEAVVDGVTGLVVRRPRSVPDATAALRALLTDGRRRAAMGRDGTGPRPGSPTTPWPPASERRWRRSVAEARVDCLAPGGPEASSRREAEPCPSTPPSGCGCGPRRSSASAWSPTSPTIPSGPRTSRP